MVSLPTPRGEWQCTNCKDDMFLAEEVIESLLNLSNINNTILKHDNTCDDKPTEKNNGEIMPLDLIADVCTYTQFKNMHETSVIKKAFESNMQSPSMHKKSPQIKHSRFAMEYLETKIKEHDKEEDNCLFEEKELDSLWLGVRRHGQSSWETILNDPILKFSNFRTPISLAKRWIVERQKFEHEPEVFQAPGINKKGSSSSSPPPDSLTPTV